MNKVLIKTLFLVPALSLMACEPQTVEVSNSSVASSTETSTSSATTATDDISRFSNRTNSYEETYSAAEAEADNLYSDLTDAWISYEAIGDGTVDDPVLLTNKGNQYQYVTRRDMSQKNSLGYESLELGLKIGSHEVATYTCSGADCETIDFVCEIVYDSNYYHECTLAEDRDDVYATYGENRYVLSQIEESLVDPSTSRTLAVTVSEHAYGGTANRTILQTSRIGYIELPTTDELELE